MGCSVIFECGLSGLAGSSTSDVAARAQNLNVLVQVPPSMRKRVWCTFAPGKEFEHFNQIAELLIMNTPACSPIASAFLCKYPDQFIFSIYVDFKLEISYRISLERLRGGLITLYNPILKELPITHTDSGFNEPCQ